jgi:RNA polymerase sigma-70 factor (ECF subfamily)
MGVSEIEGIAGPNWFMTTAWSVVVGAGAEEATPARSQCLARLCTTYWKPVYQYIRRRGLSHNDALDLTQEYFTTFLEKDYAATADRERGKFRTFVIITLSRFLSKQLEKRKRERAVIKSGLTFSDSETGDEFARAELAVNRTPEDEFNRRWAKALVDTTTEAMKNYCHTAPKKFYYEALSLWLNGISNGEPLTYQDVAQKMHTRVDLVANYMSRGRAIFQKLLRAEIRQSVTTESAIDEEITAMKEYLCAD